VPAAVILEFEGVTLTEYVAVNAVLGIDYTTGEGDWPDGLVTHTAGLNEGGHLVVMEVWDTPEHQARFMEGRLGAALAEGGVTEPPSRVTWIEVEAHHHLGD
jgi:hypothetical protein